MIFSRFLSNRLDAVFQRALFVIEELGQAGYWLTSVVRVARLRGRPLDREVSEIRRTQPNMEKGVLSARRDGRVRMSHRRRPTTAGGDS